MDSFYDDFNGDIIFNYKDEEAALDYLYKMIDQEFCEEELEEFGLFDSAGEDLDEVKIKEMASLMYKNSIGVLEAIAEYSGYQLDDLLTTFKITSYNDIF